MSNFRLTESEKNRIRKMHGSTKHKYGTRAISEQESKGEKFIASDIGMSADDWDVSDYIYDLISSQGYLLEFLDLEELKVLHNKLVDREQEHNDEYGRLNEPVKDEN